MANIFIPGRFVPGRLASMYSPESSLLFITAFSIGILAMLTMSSRIIVRYEMSSRITVRYDQRHQTHTSSGGPGEALVPLGEFGLVAGGLLGLTE